MTPERTGLSAGTSRGGRGTAVSCASDPGQRSEKQEETDCRVPASCHTARLSPCAHTALGPGAVTFNSRHSSAGQVTSTACVVTRDESGPRLPE